ncbi:phage/plasmid primase, P4 family [Thioclava sp. 15-R06ZXC-3]|uniref:Phage/plasmid primase, P4 family n=1 Tax=Thioclava arctica TaxID=3238301 RepID=A0ABV3TPM1_9RHOB
MNTQTSNEATDERVAALAATETDDTSLAQAWIAIEGGLDGEGQESAEIVRASDGEIRSFDCNSGLWSSLDVPAALNSISRFLSEVADAKLLEAEAKLRAGEIEKKSLDAAKTLQRRLRSQTQLKAVWHMACIHLKSVAVDDFNANVELLGTPGGVIDIRSGASRDASPADMVSHSTRLTPAASGIAAPRWESFLSDVFDGDAAKIGFIQRLLGSALVGDVSPQKFFVFYGRGANGKSVIREVLHSILGTYATTASAKVFMQSFGDRHPTEIASLAGKRLILASEVPTGRMWNDTLLKDLTGGEKITARRMHQDEFSFTPRGTLLFTANTLPSFPGAQEAMRRRIVLIDFKRTFAENEQDPNLGTRLVECEGSAILRWMIEGARKFLTDGGGALGLKIPHEISDSTRLYFEEEDIVLQFLRDEQSSSLSVIKWSEGTFISTQTLFGEFRRWTDENGHKNWSTRTLTKALRENAARYGLAEKRTKSARGFEVHRLLVKPSQSGGQSAGRGAFGKLHALKATGNSGDAADEE